MSYSSHACINSLTAITTLPVTIPVSFLAISAYSHPTIGKDSTKSFKLQISSCLTILCCSLNSNLEIIRSVNSLLQQLFLPNIVRKHGNGGKRRGRRYLIK